MDQKDNLLLERAIKYYAFKRPFFYVYLRPYELFLFNKVKSNIVNPVLDFGCGDGFFSAFNFKNKEIDYGVDLDSSIAIQANKFYKTFLLLKDNKIPLDDNSVSTIISNSVFEHLVNPLENLAEMFRIMKPGGKIYTTIVVKYWEDYLWGNKIFRNFYKKYMRRVQRHNSFYAPSEWEELFKKTGFKIVQKIGYLSPEEVKMVDIFHYLSFPSLLFYKITRKWDNIGTKLINRLFYKFLNNSVRNFKIVTDKAPCYFFELAKE